MDMLMKYSSESNDEDNDSLRPRDTRTVYLVTHSQADVKLFTERKQFAEAVVKSFENGGAQVLCWCCSLEEHKKSGKHYHVAVKLNKVRRWLPSKRYLIDRYGISVHYSNIHHNYYSAWRYVTKIDRQYVQSDGHTDLVNSQEPVTACASRKRTERIRSIRKRSDEEMAESGSEEQRELDGSKVKVKRKKRLSAFDVSEIIQSKKLKSITELQALAQQQKREGKTDLAEFILNRSPRVLADIFNSSYEMLNAEENISRSQKTRMEILEEVLQGDCADSCNGNWLECAKEVLRNNGIDAFNFAAAVVHSLEKGRGKFRNVMIIGPANCAKTFLLNPLNIIYKTFTNPASGRFAWVGVEQAECIFLNDFRWNADLIPWHDLLLLLEGQQVHLPAPKTHFAKDIALVNDTPIFATTKNQLVYVKNGIVDARETEMMSVRWNIITFYWQISQERQREIPPCARCFARLVTMKAS